MILDLLLLKKEFFSKIIMKPHQLNPFYQINVFVYYMDLQI